MPVAVGLYCHVAIAGRDDRTLALHSEEFDARPALQLDLDALRPCRDWSDYPAGVARMLLQAEYPLHGANLHFHSEVPMGAGLSSSAAIEVATALALVGEADTPADRIKLAQLCQQAENEFVGARCGIMDQFISLMGKRDHALVLDCRSLEYKYAPIPAGVRLVVCNTMVKHELASNEYNVRRRECEDAVKLLSKRLPGIHTLRDVNADMLEQNRAALAAIIYRRAKHVVTENARVQDAAAALREGDLARFGRHMAESHASLRDDYEVSCAELDTIVDIASRQPGCIGARMTGGGFGGSTINLVRAADVEKFTLGVCSAYRQATGIQPELLVCEAVDGACEEQ